MRALAAVVACLIVAGLPSALRASPIYVPEVEPNDTPATATPLAGTTQAALGHIHPGSEYDYYSFLAVGGNRVYAAVMSSQPDNPDLDLIDFDGTTILETDQANAGTQDPSIAGAVLPGSHVHKYYLRVRSGASPAEVRPYHLHLRIVSGPAVNEHESNDSAATAHVVTAGAWRQGSCSPSGDQDWYKIELAAGDTIYVGLDLDPSRGNAGWDGRIRFGFFGDDGDREVRADAGSNNTVTPSEALVATVRSEGTYYVLVDSSGTSTGTYNLSIAVHPNKPPTPLCITYTSTDVPKTFTGNWLTSTIVLPGHPRIADLDISMTHSMSSTGTNAYLLSPAGNTGFIQNTFNLYGDGWNVTLDDEAGNWPEGNVTASKGLVLQPSPSRLSWVDGEDAGGTWTLQFYSQFVPSGTLFAWGLTICEPAPPPVCSGVPVTLYSSDFEVDAGGFTHSGTADEWARGFPTGSSAPVLGCNSGSNCFKTDLTGSYQASSSQDLVSPQISLDGLTAPIAVEWAQAYQMENATRDHFFLDANPVSGPGSLRLFEWLGPDMYTYIASNQVQQSAGWGLMRASIDPLAGEEFSLRFHLDSDASNQYSGLAVDDVRVTGCCTTASCGGGNVCVIPACDPVLGCLRTLTSGGSCNDGNLCTIGDTCQNGVCAGTPWVNCDDGNSCTDDGCSPAVGVCWHMPHVCDDGNACTDDSCNPATGCVFTADNTNTCSDGSVCSASDVCQSGSCVGTAFLNCNDANACTTDSCDPATGCQHTGGSCDDGNFCTSDSCNPAVGCNHAPANDGFSCNDGSSCTFPDTCSGGTCHGSIRPDCASVDPCVVAWCDTSPGGVCHRDPLNCSDNNPCTNDFCTGNGFCQHNPIAAPADPTGLQIAPDRSQVSWTAATFATSYDVARGVVGQLPVGSAGASEICVASGTSATTTSDPFTPPTGQALWYVVRARNTCGISTGGAYGTANIGGTAQPRITTVCP